MLRNRWKKTIYLFAALGMLAYAVPRLEMGNGLTLPTIFGTVWLVFALLVVASHLHFILGVDKEMRQNLARTQRIKRWRFEQKFQGAMAFQAKK